jgi:hypothetical protein
MTKTVFTSYTNFKEKYGDSLPFIGAVSGAYSAPKELNVVYVEGVTAVFVRDHEIPGRSRTYYTAEAYGWKAKRNCYWYETYSTPEARGEKVLGFIANLVKHKADVAANRKGTTDHDVKVGDIFYSSWGYDQTNVDFYKVIRTTKCTADLVEIGKTMVDGDRVRANASFTGDKVYKRKRIRAGYKGNPSVRIDDVCSAYRCDPDSTHYQTPWGMGH